MSSTDEQPARTRWEAVVYRDGVELTCRVPITDHEAAIIGATLVQSVAGPGTISVTRAVVHERLRLLDEYVHDD